VTGHASSTLDDVHSHRRPLAKNVRCSKASTYPTTTPSSAATATYLGDEDVSGRGIRRHGGEVARVRLYRFQTEAGTRYLLAYLTATGAVTDYDVVAR